MDFLRILYLLTVFCIEISCLCNKINNCCLSVRMPSLPCLSWAVLHGKHCQPHQPEPVQPVGSEEPRLHPNCLPGQQFKMPSRSLKNRFPSSFLMPLSTRVVCVGMCMSISVCVLCALHVIVCLLNTLN